ncbi:MAG TPA: C25 family cysteine peptidase [Phycisphaerae bacterium]|nr:C25 family cysteine peptidase [Phycisphaerae bacterium]
MAIVLGSAAPHVRGATYLLITSDKLKTAFQPLVDRRTAQGYVGVLKSVQEIDAAYPGANTQEKIRNCVKAYYLPQDECYLCLGGDDSAVPVRYCLEDPVPTDLYYADMDGGSWNQNGNDVFGEPVEITVAELTPEVRFGRIPVRTPQQATDYIAKLIRYEEGCITAYAGALLLIGGDELGSVYYSGLDRPAGCLDHEPVSSKEIELARDTYLQEIQPYWQGLPVHFFFDTNTSWDSEYCGDYPLKVSNMKARLNEGYHFVECWAHGNKHSWAPVDDELGPAWFLQQRAAELTNTMPSIVFSRSCGTGWYDQDDVDPCLAEAFIRNPNGGAVVYFAYARGISDAPQLPQIMREIFQNHHRVVGNALVSGLSTLAAGELDMPLFQYMFCLFGDPAIRLLDWEAGRHLQLLQPKGCERLELGTTIPIRWNAIGPGFQADETIRLEFSTDSGESWTTIPGAAGLTYNGRSFPWDTTGLEPGDHYRVRVVANSDEAVRDGSQRDVVIRSQATIQLSSWPISNVEVTGDFHNLIRCNLKPPLGQALTLFVPSQPVGHFDFVGWRNLRGEVVSATEQMLLTPAADDTLFAMYDYVSPTEHYYINDDVAEAGFATGDDHNDGRSPTTPMRHIQTLLDAHPDLGWDAVLHVSEGIYREYIELGTAHDGLAIVGAGREATLFDGGGSQSCFRLDRLGRVFLAHCTFRNAYSSGSGGGIFCTFSNAVIFDCTFRNNQAGYGGGGIYVYGRSEPVIASCRFFDNESPRGGALWCKGTDGCRNMSLEVNSCLFAGNHSKQYGGAILTTNGPDLRVANCTFAHNSAVRSGGAIANRNAAAVNLRNSILWLNTGAGGQQLALLEESRMTVDRCTVEGDLAGVEVGAAASLIWSTTNACADPQFVDADGPDDDAETTADNNYRLAADSPAVNGGDNASLPRDAGDMDGDQDIFEPLPSDADGAARLQGCTVDQGCFESRLWFGQGQPADWNCDGHVDSDDMAFFLVCFSGPSILVAAGCEAADLDFDHDVDQSDFGIFQRCYSGANEPADPDCAK